MRTLAAMLVAIALLGNAHPSSAQSAAKAIKTLSTSTDEKDRTLALFDIAKAGDPRAISVCIRVLQRDSKKRIRALAARVLEKLVTAKSSLYDVARIKAALSRSARGDPEPLVRKQATRAEANVRTKTAKRSPAIPPGAAPATSAAPATTGPTP